jgi:hypothetical protein
MNAKWSVIDHADPKAPRRRGERTVWAVQFSPSHRIELPHMAEREPMSGTPDPVIDAYKPGIDRTLIRENLKRSPEERLQALQQLQAFAEELRRAGRALDRRNNQ